MLRFQNVPSCFYFISIHIQVHFRPDVIMEANAMKPDQTAPLGTV